MSVSPRKPDFRLRVYAADSNRGNDIGAAWWNDKGYLNITLKPGCSVAWNDDLSIQLFPVDGGPAPTSSDGNDSAV